MNKMFDLIEALSSNKTPSLEQAKDHLSSLHRFRFDSNGILDSVAGLLLSSSDGEELKSEGEVFRNIGNLLSMLSELNSLCEEQEGYCERRIKEIEAKQEGVS